MRDKADTYCGKCIKADVCGMEGVYDEATTYCAYRVTDRPHGEWKEKCWNDPRYVDYECSVCKRSIMNGTPNFCPNCGADMREGEMND